MSKKAWGRVRAGCALAAVAATLFGMWWLFAYAMWDWSPTPWPHRLALWLYAVIGLGVVGVPFCDLMELGATDE